MACYEINGIVPVVDPTAFVLHRDADRRRDRRAGLLRGAGREPARRLRADHHGARQQRPGLCVMHGFPGTDTIVEEDGHIGHGAILHGCIVKRNAMVGMNAVVMDEAVVGEEAMVAAGAFVKAGMVIPPRGLAVGAPARDPHALRQATSRGR